MNFGSQFAAISAPIFTGYLIKWSHSYATAFALAGFLLLVGIASYVLLLGRIERIDAPVLSAIETD